MKNVQAEQIDKNFAIETTLKLDNPRIYDAKHEPFTVYGVWHDGELYRRVDKAVAEATSDNVARLSTYPAGGRVKFRTDSEYIAIKTHSEFYPLSGISAVNASGFDLSIGVNEVPFSCFSPPGTFENGYESVRHLGDRKMREVTINMPCYSEVYDLYIILEADARVEKTRGYKRDGKILYYGSSITNGACATRPGNSYESFICRALGMDYVNLGFGGSAKGEDAIADYIANIGAEIFVYDYDHNAPDVEHLEKTHEKMFLKIRHKNPDMPILILSRPRYKRLNPIEIERLRVIKKTYENARARGDKNVYFIPGNTLMKYAKHDGYVDGLHPNDLGFYSMARVITPVLKEILRKMEI